MTFYPLILIGNVLVLHPKEVEIKHIPECSTSATHLDIPLKLGTSCKLAAGFYYKPDDFNISIVIFPYLYSIIPPSPTYIFYIYLAVYSAYKSMYNIGSFFKSIDTDTFLSKGFTASLTSSVHGLTTIVANTTLF
jgi:hypothetical protein